MPKFTLMKDSALRFGGLEFATFRLRDGVDESVLLEASEKVDRDFLANEEGILGHVLLRGRDGVYADLALADSQARAEEVCAQWTANAVALKYIELLDEESVDITFWERIR